MSRLLFFKENCYSIASLKKVFLYYSTSALNKKQFPDNKLTFFFIQAAIKNLKNNTRANFSTSITSQSLKPFLSFLFAVSKQ